MPLRKKRYHSSVLGSSRSSGDEGATSMRNARALLEAALDRVPSAELVAAYEHIQREHRAAQSDLVAALNRGMPPETYLARMTQLLRASMAKYRALLGVKDFYAVFGEAGDRPEELLADRQKFLESLDHH